MFYKSVQKTIKGFGRGDLSVQEFPIQREGRNNPEIWGLRKQWDERTSSFDGEPLQQHSKMPDVALFDQ